MKGKREERKNRAMWITDGEKKWLIFKKSSAREKEKGVKAS